MSTRDQIELIFEGRNLPSPCHLSFSLKTDYSNYIPLLKTEESMTKIHVFLKTLFVPFIFESFQQLQIHLIYEEKSVSNTSERSILISRILRTHNHQLDLRFATILKLSKANQPLISIRARNQGLKSAEASFFFSSKFANISWFIPSIYYTINEFSMEKPPENNIRAKSEIACGYDLIWPEYSLYLPSVLNEKDLEKSLKVSFFMKNWIFRDTFLGEVKLNLLDLLENKRKYAILSKEKTDIGDLLVSKVHFTRKPSFLDFIFGGLDFFLVLGSEFETSRGFGDNGFLTNEEIFASLFEFINEYDSEKKGLFFGFGQLFLQANDNKFLIEDSQEKTAGLTGETFLRIYREMSFKIEESGKIRAFPRHFQNNASNSSNNFKSKKLFIEIPEDEKLNSIKDPKDLISHPAHRVLSARNFTSLSQQSSTFNGKLTNRVSFNFEEPIAINPLKPRVSMNSARKPFSFLEEMFNEIAESLRLESKKLRSAKLRYYIIAVLISDNVELEEIAKSMEFAKRLSFELPVFTRFLYLGSSLTPEKLKSLNKNVDFQRKTRRKAARIINVKSLFKETDKFNDLDEEQIKDLRKTLIRIEIFKGLPREVIDFYLLDNTMPSFFRPESFFS